MKVTNGALADILQTILTGESGEIDDAQAFANFMNDLAQVVCQYCGGSIISAAKPVSQQEVTPANFDSSYLLEVASEKDQPGAGAIWSTNVADSEFAGYIRFGGTTQTIQFTVPAGATHTQKDAAFLGALAEHAEIDYLSVGVHKALATRVDVGLSVSQLQSGVIDPQGISPTGRIRLT